MTAPIFGYALCQFLPVKPEYPKLCFSFLRALGLLRLQFLPEKPERPKLFVRAPFFGFFGLSF